MFMQPHIAPLPNPLPQGERGLKSAPPFDGRGWGRVQGNDFMYWKDAAIAGQYCYKKQKIQKIRQGG